MTSVNCSATKSGQNRVRIESVDYNCNPQTNFKPQIVVAQYLSPGNIQVIIGNDSIFLKFENNVWTETGPSSQLDVSNVAGDASNLSFRASYVNIDSVYDISISGSNPDITLTSNFSGSTEVIVVQPATYYYGYWWIWLIIFLVIGIIPLFFMFGRNYYY